MSEYNKFYDRTGNRRYVQAFNDILLDKKLSAIDLKVYLYLKIYAGQNGKAFTGLKRMEDELGITRKTIIKSLKHLEKLDYLEIVKQKSSNGYCTNNYYIYDPYNQIQIDKFVKGVDSKKEEPKVDDDVKKIFQKVAKDLEMIQSPLKAQELEDEINKIKKDKYNIVSVAINYSKEKNKGINYLIKILENWNKENVNTVEKAKQKIKPKQQVRQEQAKAVFKDLRNQYIGGE